MNTHLNKKRILYIVQHRFNRSGGQRFRCEQYIPFLVEAGFECTYSPILINEIEDTDFYTPGNYFAKFRLFLKGIRRRLNDVRRAKDFDIIFIYREAFMTGTVIFETLLKSSGRKIVYDFDDAVWKFDVSNGNKSLGWLKRPEKTNEIIALADLVLVGSSHLALHADQFNKNVEVIPSTLDLDKYKIGLNTKATEIPLVIGWCGSVTTIKHFEIIIPVFEKLKRKYNTKVEFKVYGLSGYTYAPLNIKSVEFNPETEVSEISTYDIGVMPLPVNDWTQGKCGMKGLQYMSLGIPAVLEAVGANKEIIKDGVNGFLAASEKEWVIKLSELIESPELRKRLGAEGRRTIEAEYSSTAIKKRYVALFYELVTEIR